MNKNQFKKDLKEAIAECQKELADRKAGIIGDCTVEELEDVVLPELYHYLFLVNCNDLPSHIQMKKYGFISSHELVGGWIRDYHNPSKMACLILDLANKYF